MRKLYVLTSDAGNAFMFYANRRDIAIRRLKKQGPRLCHFRLHEATLKGDPPDELGNGRCFDLSDLVPGQVRLGDLVADGILFSDTSGVINEYEGITRCKTESSWIRPGVVSGAP